MRQDLKRRLERLEEALGDRPPDVLDAVTDAEWAALAEFRHGAHRDKPEDSPARIAAARAAAAAVEKGLGDPMTGMRSEKESNRATVAPLRGPEVDR